MNVLCVDNDDEDIEFFGDAVNKVDPTITCLSAVSGEGALNLLSSIQDGQLPAYVFLDVNMPRMNGRDTLKEIRKNFRYDSVQMVMLSTGLSPRDSGEYKELGANYFMAKANSLSDLCEKLKVVLKT
jgi:CheY-like chemotaxis protein